MTIEKPDNKATFVPHETLKTKNNDSLLSAPLRKDTIGKQGKELIKQIFSNIKDQVLTKFHRIQQGFEKGEWINNNKMMKNLTCRIKELNTSLSKDISKEELDFIEQGIMSMKEICTLLKDSGASEEKMKKLGEVIAQVEKKLNELSTNDSIKEWEKLISGGNSKSTTPEKSNQSRNRSK